MPGLTDDEVVSEMRKMVSPLLSLFPHVFGPSDTCHSPPSITWSLERGSHRGGNDADDDLPPSYLQTAFIKQEALEKAREIKVKADEEFAIEKVRAAWCSSLSGHGCFGQPRGPHRTRRDDHELFGSERKNCGLTRTATLCRAKSSGKRVPTSMPTLSGRRSRLRLRRKCA